MALKTGGGLETVSWVLTADQVKSIRQIREDRSNDFSRVSVSDVAREVVAAGLSVILGDRDTDIHTTAVSDDKVAA